MAREDCLPEHRTLSQATNRPDFVSRSHFRTSQDDSCTVPCLESVFRRDFVPWSIHGKPGRHDPPSPVQLHHRDDRYFNIKSSETTKSYPEKSQPRVGFGDAQKLRATNFKMHRDLTMFNDYSTTHSSHYQSPFISARIKSQEDPMKSSIPQGDGEKAEKPVSDYRDRFLGHDACLTKPKRAPSRHLAEGHTALGDERLNHFLTTSAENFRGLMLPRVTPCDKPQGTNVPEGDKDKEMTRRSTQRISFVEQPTSYVPNDRNVVSGMLRKTNFCLTDGLGTFDNYRSTAADSFKPKAHEGTSLKVSRERNRSDLPPGDDDPVRTASRFNMTTNKFHFDNPITLPANIVSGANLRTNSKVWFGDPPQTDRFYSTTTASTFTPNDTKYKRYERSTLTARSDIPLKYYGDEKNLTIMKSDYKNPCQSKLVPNEAAVSRIRDSHIRPPTSGRYFTTENQDEYIPKETKHMPIDGGKLQRSTVPLGGSCAT